MSAEQDQLFFKTFGIVLVLLGGLGFAAFVGAYFLSTSAAPEGLRPEQVQLAQQRTDPVYRVITDASAVQKVAMSGGASQKEASLSGQEVFKAVCHTCHVPGLLGAPKISDTAEWKKRLSSQGIKSLYEGAVNGIGNMPPKGGKASLSVEEVHAAVDYILAKAGVK